MAIITVIYGDTLIRASRVASVDFVVWKTRFYRNNVSGSGHYAEVRVAGNLLTESYKNTASSSIVLIAEAYAIPVLVLTDGSRVIMAGDEVSEGVYYPGVRATGAKIDQNSGINISASWNHSVSPSQYGLNSGGAVSYINGIFGPGNNSLFKGSPLGTMPSYPLAGQRELLQVNANADWVNNVNGYGMTGRIDINSLINTLTGANIPYTFSIASGLQTSRSGYGGDGNTWEESVNF